MDKIKMENNWIFLRGLSRGNCHWADFPEIFKKINPAAQVEFLDIPGNGHLNKFLTPLDCTEVIDQIKKSSRLCSANRPIRICGISLGGMIALKWAELCPENLVSVAVINSSLKQYSPFHKRLLPRNYVKVVRALSTSKALIKEKLILQMTSNNLPENFHHLIRFSEYAAFYPVSKNNFLRQLLLANRIHISKFPKIRLDVITSKADRFVDWDCSKALAHNLNGQLHVHKTAGHDLPLDDPQWLSQILSTIANLK